MSQTTEREGGPTMAEETFQGITNMDGHILKYVMAFCDLYLENNIYDLIETMQSGRS